MKRGQVKTKVQCMVCSVPVHCVQCRREDVSVHVEQLKDRAKVIPAIPPCLTHPRLGCCNLGNGSAGQRWNIIPV